MGESIDSLLLTYNKQNEFNGNVLLIKGGEILYDKSHGYTDSLQETSLTSNHRFGIGSIYKEFPAVSIMKLKEKGLLTLEDRINIYIPGFPEWSKEISIKNLLQYTSGLPMIDWNKYFSQNIAVTNKLVLDDLLNIKELEFTPGSNYLYTNNSPYLLMKIIEKISDQNFDDYLKEELLIPLKMTETEMKKEYPYKDRKLIAFPIDSDFKEDNYKLKLSGMLLTTTVKDLSNWITQLNNYGIINKESVEFLGQTAELESDNMQSPLGTCEMKSERIIEHIHHGQMGNYEGLVIRKNEKDITLVILTNQKNKNVFEISESIFSLIK